MAEADSTTLGALIAPGSAAEFLRDYWPDKPFAAHGDAARLPPFLRAPELDSIETLSRVYRGNLSNWRPISFALTASIDRMAELAEFQTQHVDVEINGSIHV